tara:strand:- start:627 stop:806 length:180 start_codon:yes stop_codon:yes gene_type:complete
MAEAWHRYPFDLMVEDILNHLAWMAEAWRRCPFILMEGILIRNCYSFNLMVEDILDHLA